MSDRYSKWANKYKPRGRPRILFVAEAPPNCVERYFYFDHVRDHDWLWIGLMKALYAGEWRRATVKEQRERKSYWLNRFQKDRFQLIDAVKRPISEWELKDEIEANAPALLKEVKRLRPRCIVLIKKSVHKGLFERLDKEGLRVANPDPIPFPSSGQQKNFHEKISRLDCVKRFLDASKEN